MSDQCIQYNEEMVGAGHPTKSDTLNRLALVEHNADGTHKHPPSGFISGLGFAQKDADELTVNGGAVEMGGLVYYLTSAVDLAFSGLGNDEWRYLYVSAPSSGSALAAAQFSSSTSAPTFDHAKAGWYNAAGDARCVGFFKTDGSGGIEPCYVAGGWFIIRDGISILDSASPAESLTAISAGTPDLGRMLGSFTGRIQDTSAASGFLYLAHGDVTNISGYRDSLVGAVVGGGSTIDMRGGLRTLLTNSSRQIKYSVSAGDDSAKVYLLAVAMPVGMAG